VAPIAAIILPGSCVDADAHWRIAGPFMLADCGGEPCLGSSPGVDRSHEENVLS
jgi:hypothetical protein